MLNFHFGMNSTRRTKLSRVSMEGSILACRLHIAERRAKKSCPTYDSKNAQWKIVDELREIQQSLLKIKSFRTSIFLCLTMLTLKNRPTTRKEKCYYQKSKCFE